MRKGVTTSKTGGKIDAEYTKLGGKSTLRSTNPGGKIGADYTKAGGKSTLTSTNPGGKSGIAIEARADD